MHATTDLQKLFEVHAQAVHLRACVLALSTDPKLHQSQACLLQSYSQICIDGCTEGAGLPKQQLRETQIHFLYQALC